MVKKQVFIWLPGGALQVSSVEVMSFLEVNALIRESLDNNCAAVKRPLGVLIILY